MIDQRLAIPLQPQVVGLHPGLSLNQRDPLAALRQQVCRHLVSPELVGRQDGGAIG
ncbi:hypothetical protein D3C80_1648930 [compost metagenome]